MNRPVFPNGKKYSLPTTLRGNKRLRPKSSLLQSKIPKKGETPFSQPSMPAIFYTQPLPHGLPAQNLKVIWPTVLGSTLTPEAFQKSKLATFRIVKPETPLEREIVGHPDFLVGVQWGNPRRGHPEGSVLNHIAKILAGIERMDQFPETAPYQNDPSMRTALRVLTLLHDTFKSHSRSSEMPVKLGHNIFAAQMAQELKLPLLWTNMILFHDYCFYIENHFEKTQNLEIWHDQAQALLGIVEPHTFYAFTYLDRRGGDGNTTILDRFWKKAIEWGLFTPKK